MELIIVVAFIFFLGWCFGKIGAWLVKIGKEVERKEASQELYRREMLSSTRALEGALVPREVPVSVKLARAQQALEDKRNARKQVEELCKGSRP